MGSKSVVTILILVFQCGGIITLLLPRESKCTLDQVSCNKRCSKDPGSETDRIYFCNCDEACQQFNDCCGDVNDVCSLPQSTLNHTNKYECVRVSQQQQVYLTAICHTNTSHHTMIKPCEHPIGPNKKDPLYITPVTDNSTGISYKNIFCAKCNEIESKNIVFWKHRIKCNTKYYVPLAGGIQVNNVTSDSLWQAVFDNREMCEVNFTLESTNTQLLPLRECQQYATSCDDVIPPLTGIQGDILYLGFDILMDVTSNGKIRIFNHNFLGVARQWKNLVSECTLNGCKVESCPNFYKLQDGHCVYNEILMKIKYEMKLIMTVQYQWMFYATFNKGELVPVLGYGIPVFGVPQQQHLGCKDNGTSGFLVCKYEFHINYKIPKSLSPTERLTILNNNMALVDESIQHLGIKAIIATSWSIISENELADNLNTISNSLTTPTVNDELNSTADDLLPQQSKDLSKGLPRRGTNMIAQSEAENITQKSIVAKGDCMIQRSHLGTLILSSTSALMLVMVDKIQ